MDQRPVPPNAGQRNPGLTPNAPERAKGRKGANAGKAQGPARQNAAPGADGASAGTPAFHVLLERLSQSARELQERADRVERPSDLAGAVGRAKASLDDALSLGEELLEAWRAGRMNAEPPKSDR